MNQILRKKETLLGIAMSVVFSFGLFLLYTFLFLPNRGEVVSYDRSSTPFNYVHASELVGSSTNPMVDFTKASLASVPAVVHIKTTYAKQMVQQKRRSPFGDGGGHPFFDDFFDGFFGFGPQIIPEQQAAGSGVIVSSDGYILTNNHVITDQRGGVAKEIKVTLSNRQDYDAELVGNDPSSDIAVIRIKGKGLPYLVYSNSDEVSLGQWVLAVGYPLNLDATVTAGIVSAKARTLGINYQNQQKGSNVSSAIESFIQTDAAVNKGNSGGALVNLKGELVGINSAIATPTGYYSGYSFAIPSNIVKKIANDIIKYGKAQRGYLGISFPNDDTSEKARKESGTYVEEGVYISEAIEGGAAKKAGLKKGDVLIRMDGKKVVTGAELSARLALYKPGDKVKITYLRDDKEKTVTVTLKNSLGTYEVSKRQSIEEMLGAELEELSDSERAEYNVRSGGLRVKKIEEKGLISKTRMDKGFIILSVSGRRVEKKEDFYNLLAESRGQTLKIEGFYPGSEGLYAYPIKIE